METLEIINTIDRVKRDSKIVAITAVIVIIAASVWTRFQNSEMSRLKEFEAKMKPYESYNMQVCGILNKYMEYLSGIDETTRMFNNYEKSINELQKQNPKYDILAIDAFLKKEKTGQ